MVEREVTGTMAQVQSTGIEEGGGGGDIWSEQRTGTVVAGNARVSKPQPRTLPSHDHLI